MVLSYSSEHTSQEHPGTIVSFNHPNEFHQDGTAIIPSLSGHSCRILQLSSLDWLFGSRHCSIHYTSSREEESSCLGYFIPLVVYNSFISINSGLTWRGIGTGWGSVAFLRDLDIDNYNVSVISPRNYFLFTPLLPSCITGLVEQHSLMEPIHNFFKGEGAVEFCEAEATEVDPERRVVHVKRSGTIHGEVTQSEIPYDMLVVGVGAENATFSKSPNTHLLMMRTNLLL